MKTSSAKSKGRRLQQLVVQKLLDKFKQLTERDMQSTPMGCTGDDIKLSETAYKMFPYSVECKNQERLNIWDALKQANGRQGTPLLVFSRNRTPVYCALTLDDFLKLI